MEMEKLILFQKEKGKTEAECVQVKMVTIISI
jgi:hypothetical protein